MDVRERNWRFSTSTRSASHRSADEGLYQTIGGDDSGRQRELALLWVLNLSDGEHCLLDIAERSGMPFEAIQAAADALLEVELLREVR
jgi:aminopeptidase-like protein